MQTACTKRMRKCAELSTEVKKHSQVEAMCVCTVPVTVSATVDIPHTFHDVLKQPD